MLVGLKGIQTCTYVGMNSTDPWHEVHCRCIGRSLVWLTNMMMNGYKLTEYVMNLWIYWFITLNTAKCIATLCFWMYISWQYLLRCENVTNCWTNNWHILDTNCHSFGTHHAVLLPMISANKYTWSRQDIIFVNIFIKHHREKCNKSYWSGIWD